MFKKSRKGVIVIFLLFLSLIGLTAAPAGATQVFLGSNPGIILNNFSGWPEDQGDSISLYHDGTNIQDSWHNNFYHAPGNDVHINDVDACTEVWVRLHTKLYRPPDVSWNCQDSDNPILAGSNQLHYINSNGTIGRALYWANSGPIPNDLNNNGLDVAVCRVNWRTWIRSEAINCLNSGSNPIAFANFTGLSPASLNGLQNFHRPENVTYIQDHISNADWVLHPGDHMVAANGYANAVMQFDGNFVIYNNSGTPIWNSGTQSHPGAIAKFQSDGNFVIYSAELGGHALWWTGTSRACCFTNWNVWMQGDRNFVIYDGSGHPVWATGTH